MSARLAVQDYRGSPASRLLSLTWGELPKSETAGIPLAEALGPEVAFWAWLFEDAVALAHA